MSRRLARNGFHMIERTKETTTPPICKALPAMPHPTTSFDRAVALQRLRDEEFDAVVIGGGVTGAGVALDAAARGLKTALVERTDFASGTSSKSSKLVHGGLRYLQQKEFGLVHENLTERHRLLKNAPHLVEPLTFLIPLFGKGGAVDKGIVQTYSIALWLYDLAGGIKIGKRHKKVTAEEIYSHLPTLRHDRVVAGFLYYDARTDDARLTLSIVRTAALSYGAVAANYAPVVGYLRDKNGRLAGVRIQPSAEPSTGQRGPAAGAETIEVRAKAVVNATGIWADQLRSMDHAVGHDELRPAKGVHLAVPREKVPCDVAAIIPVRADKRSIFVVPWGEHTYLGTTDTDYEGSLDDPRVTEDDVAYVIGAINAVVDKPISAADVTGTWAGLRPLLAAKSGKHKPSARTADLSRRHRVIHDPDGLVTITGGKLTTYRKMAEDTVDVLGSVLDRKLVKCPTRRLGLRGSERPAAGPPPGVAEEIGPEQYASLVARYGAEATAVAGLTKDRPELAKPLVDGLEHLAAEAVYAVRYEMAQTLEDVLSRRMRAVLFAGEATLRAAAAVAALIGADLGWDEGRQAAEVEAFRRYVEEEMRPLTDSGGKQGDAVVGVGQ
jgi:glycerol-3-phosphate dehydrogenase